MSTDLERVIRLVDWLIFERVAENKRSLAGKLGYTESSLSQILNGKVSLSNKFIKKLANINSNINEDWLLTGDGEMLNNTKPTTLNISDNAVTVPPEIWEVIKNQAASLKAKDEQMNRVIAMLEREIEKRGDDAEEYSRAVSRAVGE